jgi:hypothetical protein
MEGVESSWRVVRVVQSRLTQDVDPDVLDLDAEVGPHGQFIANA